MAFLKRLRPMSKASFKEKPTLDDSHSNHSDKSGESAHPSDHSNAGASTPASSVPSSASTTSIHRMGTIFSKQADSKRPAARPLTGAESSTSQNRRSMSHLTVTTQSTPQLPEGYYAPTVTNFQRPGTWVHTKVVLLRGYCGDSTRRPLDGRLVVFHDKDAFPSTKWDVHAGQFKALVHLSPGPNTIRLEFFSQKLADNRGSKSLQRRELKINYLPMNNSPPLRLAIFTAKDSGYTFDSTPERIQREGNGLNVAVKKYRMAAQLWQAFMAEEMSKDTMGRRTFRLEEEYTMSTLSWQDQDAGVMRNEPMVNIVQIDKTLDELHAMGEAELLDAAVQALHEHLRPYPDQVEHVAGMLLDTHWNGHKLTGHAAIAGGDANIKVALYGSQGLYAYPSCIEEVVPAFQDSVRADPTYVSNVDGNSGSSWEAANTAMWSHLREVSKMFGCEEQVSGIMCSQQRARFSRSFTTNESYCTAEQRKGVQPVLERDEMGWCKLDLLRFRNHPCFRIPNDPPPTIDCEIQIWALNDSRIHFSARDGVTFIEAYAENERTATLICDLSRQQTASDGSIIRSANPAGIVLSEKEIRTALPKDKTKGRVRVVVHSAGTARAEIPDLSRLWDDKKIKFSGGKAYRSPKIGHLETSNPVGDDLILHNAIDTHQRLQSLRVYFGQQDVYGLEFLFEGNVSQSLGSTAASGDWAVDVAQFDLNMHAGEALSGFSLNVGATNIEAIRLSTNQGRRSPWYGRHPGARQPNIQSLVPPSGYIIAGVSGTFDTSLASFAILVKV